VLIGVLMMVLVHVRLVDVFGRVVGGGRRCARRVHIGDCDGVGWDVVHRLGRQSVLPCERKVHALLSGIGVVEGGAVVFRRANL